MRPVLAVLLIIIAFLAIYARVHTYGYVWDDISLIAENPIYDGPVVAGLLATQHDHMDPTLRKLSGVTPAHETYRPLLFLSHRLDVALFGFEAGPQHLHSVLLGVLAVVAFYVVARTWLQSPEAAVVAAAVFALHPLQVETVAYISARGDLLAGLFGLLTLFCAQRVARQPRAGGSRGPTRWVLGAGLCFLLSLLSKEAYIGLPLAMAGTFAVRDELRSQRAVLATLIGVLGVYLVLRISVAGTGTGVSILDAFLAWPGVWLSYLAADVLPFDLSTERLYDTRLAWPGWTVILLCGLAAYLAWRRKSWRFARLPLSGIFWMITLLGVSTFIVVLSGTVADRYAYLPMAGFAIVVAWLACLAPIRRSIRLSFQVMVGTLAVLWVSISVLQVPVWKDNHTLYAHAVAAAPNSSMARYRLGYTYAKQQQWQRALPYFEEAVRLDPTNTRALNNLGVCNLNLRRLPEAQDAFQEVLRQTRETHYRAWFNLGTVHFEMGYPDEGCHDLSRALEINPGYSKARAAYAGRCNPRSQLPTGMHER